MERLRKRAEYLAAARGRRTARRAFVMETRARGDGGPVRFGFTVTKRLAKKAVERNRIRRRLKEAVRQASAAGSNIGCDHVLVGRTGAIGQDFASLVADVAGALRQAQKDAGARRDEDPRSTIV